MARFAGKLHTWNEERGFGFIRPGDGGQDIFVHVSALPTPRPQPDEVLTFEVGLNREGKKKALDVRRQQLELAGLAADTNRAARHQRVDRPGYTGSRSGGVGKFLSTMISIAFMVFIGWYGYKQFQEGVETRVVSPEQSAPGLMQPSASTVPSFQCDGRQHCSQMSSCEEANFFLRNCPGTKMDGDGDGMPCERGPC